MFIDAPGGAAGNASDDDEEKPRTRLDSDGFSKFEEAAANMTIETAETTSGVSRNGTALLKNNNVGGGTGCMNGSLCLCIFLVTLSLFYGQNFHLLCRTVSKILMISDSSL